MTLSSDLCKSVPAAQYAYKGKARQDQLYIDKSIEFGVRGCGHPRPAPRPAMWDAPKSSVLPTIIVPAKPALSPKKRRWWQRKTA